jgi:hypothetical protein
MKKIFKWIVVVLVVAFLLLQFANPARTNPPVVNDLMATERAAAASRRDAARGVLRLPFARNAVAVV